MSQRSEENQERCRKWRQKETDDKQTQAEKRARDDRLNNRRYIHRAKFKKRVDQKKKNSRTRQKK